ncbi:M48 family metallopeptidase [Cellulophaga sp. BC115SP]|uniref:M48 family metallopeptidase n=1 Tax=Cellulophaga sp. BC115SP TaxID=2683263 RepID=UPI0014123603|nr:M48 family metallopeptidase [Cellulophaga sp. BC115SP]NBB31527.1 M48 family metalloprotease [Cellulophaga sp. BC115SP]
MKNLLSIIAISIGIISTSFAQKVGHSYTKIGHVVSFVNTSSSPRMKFMIDDDWKDLYFIQEFSDTSLVFKNEKEAKEYDKLYQKRQDLIKDQLDLIKKIELAQTAKKPKDAQKLQEKHDKIKIEAIDIRQYLNNRTYLKPGMTVNLTFEYFHHENRNVVTKLTIMDDFTKKDKIEGLIESTGDVAVVNGKKVRLTTGSFLSGKNRTKKKGGYEGRIFKSFSELDMGMSLELSGRYQEDGIFLVSSGEVYPSDYNSNDDKLKKIATEYIKFKGNTVSMGKEKFDLIKEGNISNYVDKIGQSLIPAYMKMLPTTSPDYVNFKFHIIKNDDFNACAYSDGNIFINTGLLLKVENTSQLATVLSHEIAHVVNKHSRKNYETSKSIGDIMDFISEIFKQIKDTTLLGIDKSEMDTFLRAYGAPAFSAGYSRTLETEADRCGLYYMTRAGYDPREASEIWYNMSKSAISEEVISDDDIFTRIARIGEKKMASIYSSHPELLKRAHNIDMLVAMNFGDKNFENDRSMFQSQQQEYQSFKKHLSAVLSPPKVKIEPVSPPSTHKPEDKSKYTQPPKSKPKKSTKNSH